MSRFSAAVLTTNTTSNSAIAEIINAHASKDAYVKKITASLNTAAAGVISVGRPAAAGVVPSTTANPALLDEAGDDTGSVTLATAWNTSVPTIPAVSFRRIGVPATVGTTVVWEFLGKGLRLQHGQTLVVWSHSGTSNVYSITAEVEQDLTSVA
jgi:hypothetical protein